MRTVENFIRALGVAAVVVGLSTPVVAQSLDSSSSWLQGFDDWISELSEVKATDFQWSVGAGMGVAPDYAGGDNYKALGLPLFQIRLRDKLTVDPLGVRFRIWRSDCCRFRLFAGMSESRGADKDTPVAKLPDVDRGVNLGFVFEGRIVGPLAFRLNGRKEVAGGHGGVTMSPSLGVILRTKDQTYSVIPEIATTWANGRYMNAFFGVTPAGATVSGLAPFAASSGFREVSLRLTSTYRFNENWTMIGRLQASRLTGDAKRSSIVRQAGDEDQGLIGFGFLYTF